MNHPSWRFNFTALSLVATLALTALSAAREPESLARPLDTLPREIGSWSGADNPALDRATESVLKASSYLSRKYRDGDKWLDFFTAFYALQSAGETMHSPRNCLPGSGWEVWKYDTVDVPVNGGSVTINRYGVRNGASRMLVLYWYQTSDRVVASDYYAKVCLIWDAVTKSRTSGSIVRLALPDQPWATEAGIDFASRVIPEIARSLPPSS
jgi:EpsI family protein